ncbi:dephospho-CoA kinase [Marmoricola sp. OAE513]|uniref:dephospho-CoA kinase n=1 Tax=Marmoricola sp. OAE513 TaxID=2817894 RepID=UPI001AE9829F
MTTRVGLTGGIASGKSTVSAILAELGAVIIDGDVLAREVVQKGTPGLAAVVAEFGEGILTPDGDLDRPAMGALVFGDAAARKRLEAIVHPLVFERIIDLEANAPEGSLVVHDIPLLAESGRADTFDAVVVVDVPAELQVERMVRDRGWTEDEARSRMAAQASREDRLAIASHVIENTGTLEDLRRRVTEVFEVLGGRG